MNSLNFSHTKTTRFTIVLFLSALFISACSGSSGSQSSSQVDTSNNGATITVIESTDAVFENSGAVNDSTETPDAVATEPVASEPGDPTSTRVDFDITVPAYQSNTLQVRLQWGGIDSSAEFFIDESWTFTDDFPIDTENELVVTFNDDNGAITLGSFNQVFRTGSNPSESIRITADQFDTARWDNDGDGISNLDELIAGTAPLVFNEISSSAELPLSVLANLELVVDKTFRLSWQASEGTEFYRILENPDGVSGYSPISGDLQSSALSFDHRIALYDRVNARYIVQACNSNGCTDSDEQIITGNLEPAIGIIKPDNPDNAVGSNFNIKLSGDGNTLLVGSETQVVVYVREGGIWIEQAILDDGSFNSSSTVGALSMSADGNTLVIGLSNDSSAAIGVNGDQQNPSISQAGAVIVYVRNNDDWQQQAFIKASNPRAADRFGSAVSLSANGDALVVGAPSRGSRDAGAAYVFRRNNGIWREQAFLLASNEDQLDRFGAAVAMSGNGNTLAVGATGEDSTATGINGNQSTVEGSSAENSGAVYVFSRTGDNWQQEAYVKAPTIQPTGFFGSNISLSGSGDVLVAMGFRTSAEVYSRSGGDWQHQTTLIRGFALDISENGRLIAVGLDSDDSAATGINGDQSDTSAPFSGAVFLFARSDADWNQHAYVKPSNTTRDFFGRTLSLSADGLTLAVGGLRRAGIQLY